MGLASVKKTTRMGPASVKRLTAVSSQLTGAQVAEEVKEVTGRISTMNRRPVRHY